MCQIRYLMWQNSAFFKQLFHSSSIFLTDRKYLKNFRMMLGSVIILYIILQYISSALTKNIVSADAGKTIEPYGVHQRQTYLRLTKNKESHLVCRKRARRMLRAKEHRSRLYDVNK